MKKKYYIVGLDFGHGETAAWIVPIVDKTKLPHEGEPLRLNATDAIDERAIRSVVFRTRDGQLHIVEELCSNVIGKMKRTVAELNKAPHIKEAYKTFIRLVVERLVELNPELTLADEDGRPNFYMCMASPTRWSDFDKNEYLKFFNDAIAHLGVKFEWIINESDAAFFSHKYIVDHDKVTLIIDYGSRTIDYTVMYHGKKVSKDEWSNPQLGAGNIEKAILDSYRATRYDEYQKKFNNVRRLLEDSSNGHIDIEEVLDLRIRSLKEDSYKYSRYNRRLDYSFGELTYLFDGFDNDRFSFPFNLIDVTQDYRNAVRSDFESLKGKIEAAIGRSVDCVILSGGANIMNWVYPMTKEVFGNVEVIKDNHPSFVVARGIALYAKAQHDAMEHLLDEVDFAQIYRDADVKATREAIKECSGDVQEKILASTNCKEMVQVLCDFIKDLNGDNPEYVRAVTAHVNEEVSTRVREELQKAFMRHFNWQPEDLEINLGLNVQCLYWVDGMFDFEVSGREIIDKPGGWAGTIMNSITDILKSFKILFQGTNWTTYRDLSERDEIASCIVDKVLEKATWLNTMPYGEGNIYLRMVAAEIWEKTLIETEKIFYDSQLFRTTFAQ